MDTSSNKIIELGYIDKGTGKHQSNIVYSIEGVSPTVCAMFSIKQPPTMVIVEDLYKNESPKPRPKMYEYYSPTLLNACEMWIKSNKTLLT